MNSMVKASLILLSILYPFIVYWGIQHDAYGWLLTMLAGLLVLRWITASSAQERYFLCLAVIVIGAVVWWLGEKNGLKLYPVIINLSLLFLFASSLLTEMSVVERLARIREPELPEKAVLYTRKVTQIWCLFFAFNATLALITVLLADDALWLWYNGVVAYFLIGGLMLGEWLVRQRVKAA
ncbi:MAG: hypothetical protein CMH21_06350 [Methylophaga sp.]|nr:hypothetical protein [Methylophaga sp.]MAY17341.1 hypothetical protein [Methylophaga sp.]HCD04819.1 hypothetical protein [Methylophaga sp.]|tara:strand:- start:31149 stop:31691 length:543 start_codon:yes stop_codon:yes gene_type:complete